MNPPFSLRTLEAEFHRHESRIETWTRVKAEPFKAKPSGPYGPEDLEQVTGPKDYYIRVGTLAEAQGLWFLCPQCFRANGGAKGTHWISVGFAGRAPAGTFSQNKEGKDTRWNIAGGTGLDDLVLTPSIHLKDVGCQWHGFVGTAGIPPGHAA